MVFGEVRKKKARVMWKREREVMIVAPDINAIARYVVKLLLKVFLLEGKMVFQMGKTKRVKRRGSCWHHIS